MKRAMAGAAACLLYAACTLVQAGAPLALHTLEWAPYSWRDKSTGTTVGIAVDIVHELLARAHVPVSDTDVIPWARGLALTASTPNTCQMMVGRTPERERRYQWIGPLGLTHWKLFAAREDKIVLNSLDDARPYLVGTIIGDLSIPILRGKGIRIAEVASDHLNPPKLLRRRIDLWASAELPALYVLNDLGIRTVAPVFNLTSVQMYLACNPSMSDGDVARLNNIVKAMIGDKSLERIYAGYGFRYD